MGDVLKLPSDYSLGLFPKETGGYASIRYNGDVIGYVVRMGGNDKYLYCARMGYSPYYLFSGITKKDYAPDLHDVVYKCIIKHRLGLK